MCFKVFLYSDWPATPQVSKTSWISWSSFAKTSGQRCSAGRWTTSEQTIRLTNKSTHRWITEWNRNFLLTWKDSANPLLPQGTYVLQDNKFCLLTQLSSGKQYLDQAPKVHFQFLSQAAIAWVEWNTPLCVFSFSTSLFHVAWWEEPCLTLDWTAWLQLKSLPCHRVSHTLSSLNQNYSYYY